MKRRMIAVFLVTMALLIVPILHFTNLTALAGSVGQQQLTAAEPSDSEMQSHISALTEQIQRIQQQLQQARKEMQQLQQELKALSQAKPTPPPGSNPAATAQYQKNLSAWQKMMAELKGKIAAKDNQIKMLEDKLRKLEQELQNIQGGSAARRTG